MYKSSLAVLLVLFGLPLGVGYTAMIEIKTAEVPSIKTPAGTIVTKESEETLTQHHNRAKDMISHIREEYTKAGCPAMWKAVQCNQLAEVFESAMKFVGSQGANAGVTITGSTFYGGN